MDAPVGHAPHDEFTVFQSRTRHAEHDLRFPVAGDRANKRRGKSLAGKLEAYPTLAGKNARPTSNLVALLARGGFRCCTRWPSRSLLVVDGNWRRRL